MHHPSSFRKPLFLVLTFLLLCAQLFGGLLPAVGAPSVIATVGVSGYPIDVAVNSSTNLYYVARTSAGSVNVMNGATNAVTATVAVGSAPYAVEVNESTNRIYSANYSSNNVSVIDGATNTVITTVGAGTAPYALDVNPTTNMIYVVNMNSDNVSVINGATNTVTATIGVGDRPTGVAVNSGTNLVYVANANSNTVSVINGATNTVTATIPVGDGPEAIDVNATTNRIYVANQWQYTVSVIEGGSNAVVATVSLGNMNNQGLTINPVTNRVYVSSFYNGVVNVIDASGNTVTANFGVGSGPWGVGVNPSTSRIYIGNSNGDTVSVVYDPYAITASAGPGGSISPSGTIGVNPGGSQAFTISPDTGYHISQVFADGVYQGAPASFNFSNVHADHTISAQFAVNTYTVSASVSGGHGSVQGTQSVNYNESAGVAIVPDAGYHIASITDNGSARAVSNPYVINNVTAAHNVVVTFAPDTFTLSASAGPGGSISPTGATVVDYGGSQSYTITPLGGRHIADVLVDGISVGAVASYNFTSVAASHTISASFALDSLTITASAGSGGSISPAGPVAVDYGADKTFSINPEAHYHVADVLVDGASVGAMGSYTFAGVAAAHTISASFALDTYAIYTFVSGSGEATGGGACVHGATVDLTATPDTGWHFVNWTENGTVVSTDASYSFTASSSRILVACFAVDTHTITATVDGSGTTEGAGTYDYGSTATLTATPAENRHFTGWTEGGVEVSTSASYSFTVTGDRDLTAHFAVDTFTVNASVFGGHGSVEPASQSVPIGGIAGIDLVPDPGYHASYITDNGETKPATDPYVIEDVSEEHNVFVFFEGDSDAWYLAEGCTAGGVETWVMVENVNDFPVSLGLVFSTPQGVFIPIEIEGTMLAPGSRVSFNVGNFVESYQVSTMIRASGGDVVCERAMYGNERTWATDSIGTRTPASTWYLAEGSTGEGFETWVLVQNPGDAEVTVDLTLTTSSGELKPEGLQGVSIPAVSRRSFNLNDFVTDYDVSTVVSASGPVVAERSMYGNDRAWGTCSIGTAAPAATWYLAEGSTGEGFETWVLVQNPGDAEVTVDLTLTTSSGELKPEGLQDVVLPAGTRRSFNLNDFVTDYDVSTVVSASGPVVAERSMYGNDRAWGTCSIGTAAPAATWYLAEGSTGEGFETWVLVQNPGDTEVNVDLTFFTSTGPVEGPQDVAVPAGYRKSFRLNDFVTDYDISTVVSSTGGDVVVERSMYGNGRLWATCSIGYAP